MIGRDALEGNGPHAPTMTIQRAWIQDGSASSGEAAHVLPGQLLINGKPPWALARGDKAIAAWIARFEVTAAVPTDFNTADTAAEKAGLKEAFLQACQRAWERVEDGERDLTATYREFLRDATRAFEKAQLLKEHKERDALRKGKIDESNARLSESVLLRLYRTHGVTAEAANRLHPLVTDPRRFLPPR